jgi:hypothetical protein
MFQIPPLLQALQQQELEFAQQEPVTAPLPCLYFDSN